MLTIISWKFSNSLATALKLDLYQLLLPFLHSQTILPMSVLLAIPVQLLTFAATIAERAAFAAILALFTIELGTTAATAVTHVAKDGGKAKVILGHIPSKVIIDDF